MLDIWMCFAGDFIKGKCKNSRYGINIYSLLQGIVMVWEGYKCILLRKVTVVCLNMRRNDQAQAKQQTDGCDVFEFSSFVEKRVPKRKRFFGRALV